MWRGAWWWALGLGVVACEQDYSASATFCDDWCDAALQPCAQSYDPAECVAGCEDERRKAPISCLAEREVLIECLRTTPGGKTTCFSDFGGGGVCENERGSVQFCLGGGEEGRIQTNCAVLCSGPCSSGSDEFDPSFACSNDCIARGLGRVECDLERAALDQCRYEHQDECFAGETTGAIACQRQHSALDACGARVIGAEGAEGAGGSD